MIAILAIILVFMIIGAIIAVETDDLLSAIVSVGASGFCLSLAFIILQAPDVAVTQIVVEVLALVILIRATISRDRTFIAGPREFFGLVVTVVLILLVLLVGVKMFEYLPTFGDPVLRKVPDAPALTYLKESLSKTGAGNVVTAILIDFRAYDTLGEGTILFTSLIGVLVLLRKRARRKTGEPEK